MTARTLAALLLLPTLSLAEEPSPAASPTPSPTGPASPVEPSPGGTPPGDAQVRRDGSGPAPSALPPAARTLSGTVKRIEIEPRRLVLDASDGPVTVVVDRNTAVYTDTGTGTLRDVRAGAPVRVSVTGDDQHALWVEVIRPEPAVTGVPPALARPAEPASGGPAAAGESSRESGSHAPATPPVSPTLPPRPGVGTPPGPGPVPGGRSGSDPTTGTAPTH